MTEYTEAQTKRMRLLQNREWMEHNFQQIQREWGDKWIVIYDNKIAASGESYDDVMQSFRGKEGEAILLLVPSGKIAKPY